ncbi:MAG: hypothetical protein QY323_02655 [Patescibacteria group bacterium]|nr:MAG: hypothetical protein QY323_02655 [Patescibacteria group bacterium]
MSFESPSERKEERSAARPGISRKALVWVGALAAFAGGAENAEAGPKNSKSKEVVEKFAYTGTMTGIERAEDLVVDNEMVKELSDGKVVTVYEGEHIGTGDKESANVLRERVLDVHVMDDPDPKVKGDERWAECQVKYRKVRDDKFGEVEVTGFACLDSAGHRDASGLHMESPVGTIAFFEPHDKEYDTVGAQPKTKADRTLYELNNLYWAVKGLKETGMDQSDLAQYLNKQFRVKVGEALSHEKTHPVNEDVVEEFMSK